MLDEDHHALDGLRGCFVQQANEAIQSENGSVARTKAGLLRDGLADLELRITRHLEDEEDLIVPVLLKFGSSGLG